MNARPPRIAVAMSGGVDSSVAAALLGREGWEVIGFTLRLGSAGGDWEARNACCGLTELHDARRVADRLGLRHYVLDQTAAFTARVIDDFVSEYAAGRTPNPCVRCNQHIKFATFLDHARAFDCSAVATGHYARTAYDEAIGRWQLRRGLDDAKDQSYVLHTLTQEQLAAARFPLGELRKPAVREIAASLGLLTADKPDSQEICFVNDHDYASFVTQRAPQAAQPGELVDADGHRLGTHDGIAHFTIGQRKGLGVTSPEPLYVSEIHAASRQVVLEPAAAAGRRRFTVSGLNWLSVAPPAEPLACTVQVRYRMAPAAATLTVTDDGAAVILNEPLRGIAPGQSAVFYHDDRVLAGGTVEQTFRDSDG